MSSFIEKFKGKYVAINQDIAISHGFFGEELNASLVSLILLMLIKNSKKKLKLGEVQILLGNVLYHKYSLSKPMLDAFSKSPNLYERVSEAIIFLEIADLVLIENESEKCFSLTVKGEDFLEFFQKEKTSLCREFRIVIKRIYEDGVMIL